MRHYVSTPVMHSLYGGQIGSSCSASDSQFENPALRSQLENGRVMHAKRCQQQQRAQQASLEPRFNIALPREVWARRHIVCNRIEIDYILLKRVPEAVQITPGLGKLEHRTMDASYGEGMTGAAGLDGMGDMHGPTTGFSAGIDQGREMVRNCATIKCSGVPEQ